MKNTYYLLLQVNIPVLHRTNEYQGLLKWNTFLCYSLPHSLLLSLNKTEIIKMSYIYVLENFEIYTYPYRWKHKLSNGVLYSIVCQFKFKLWWIEKLVPHFTGDTQTAFSAIYSMLVNGGFFWGKIEKISRIFLRSVSRKRQNTNVWHFEYLSLIYFITLCIWNILYS